MNKFFRGCVLYSIIWSLVACSAGMTDSQYIEKAQNYFDKGEFRAASIEVKNALKKNSENADARWLLGRLYLEMGDAASAEKELKQARDLGISEDSTLPLLAQALLLQGKHDDVQALSSDGLSAGGQAVVLATQSLALLARGEVDEAELQIDKAISFAPQSAYVRVARARLLAVKRDYDLARNELNDVLKRNPDDASAWSLLGDIELKEQHLDKAEAAYAGAIKYRVNDLADLLKLSLVRIQLKKFEQAQNDIDALQKSAPEHAGVNYAQGLIYYFQNNLPEAQVAFEQAVNNNYSYLPVVYYLSLTHLRQGNLLQAEQYGNQFLAAAPESPPGRKLMAMINLENQRYEKAEELVRPLALFNDKDVIALNLLANALLKQGKTDEVIELLQKVASLQPDSPVAQVRLGTGLLAAGAQSSGVEHLETALELSPQYQQADILLVLNYLRQKDYEKALVAAQAYRNRNPDSAAPINLIGRVYLAAKQEAQAEKAFSQALDIAPGDPAASQSLAALALKNKDFDKARGYYQEALKHHENYLPILLKLAALDALEKKEQAMVRHLQQAMTAHPEATQPRVALARYYLSKGKADQVPALLNELDDVQRKSPAVLNIMALSQLARKTFLEAKFTLEQLIELQPKSVRAHHRLAQAYAGLNDAKGMQIELEKAVELAPEYFPARLALTRLLLMDGRKEAAAEQLKVLREQQPEQPEVLHLEASLANLRGDQEAALIKLEQAFEKSPNTAPMLALARQKWGMGDREGAIRLQKHWVNEHPSDITAKLALANAYTLENQVDAAMEQYHATLDKNERNLVALNNLAWYLRDSKPRKALEYAKRASDIEPDSGLIMDTLAVLLLKNGETEKAKRAIARALKKAPDNPAIRYHDAMINAAAGERTLAINTLTALLKEGANFSEKVEAEQLLEKLRSGG